MPDDTISVDAKIQLNTDGLADELEALGKELQETAERLRDNGT